MGARRDLFASGMLADKKTKRDAWTSGKAGEGEVSAGCESGVGFRECGLQYMRPGAAWTSGRGH